MPTATTKAESLSHLWQQSRVLICVGAGGVGKTTIAATLAIQGALSGRKVLVLTIDPARRLADAMGLSGLNHQIQVVPAQLLRQVAAAQNRSVPKEAHLSAMMVEQKPAFDAIVKRYAQTTAQAERIFQNPIYEQISTSLPGAHEYASMSVLYDCAASPLYDLIVLDTPPTTNALDFLETPGQISQAIDSKALAWLVSAYGSKSSSLRVLGLGGTLLIKGLARLAGSTFLEQTAQFVVEFGTILQGLKNRALEISSLLTRRKTEFVIVSSPESLAFEEAATLHQGLQQKNLTIAAWILNRTRQKGPPPPPKEDLITLFHAQQRLEIFSEPEKNQFVLNLIKTYEEEQILANRDEKLLSHLRQSYAVPVQSIPLFSKDIYGPEGLAKVTLSLQASEHIP